MSAGPSEPSGPSETRRPSEAAEANDPRAGGGDAATAARPLRILLALESSGPGGAENMVVTLARALPDGLILALADIPSLAATLDLLFSEAQEQHCGQQAILDRLMEVSIVLLLRDLMDQNRLQVGLLAGLADATHTWQIRPVDELARGFFFVGRLMTLATRFRPLPGDLPRLREAASRLGNEAVLAALDRP